MKPDSPRCRWLDHIFLSSRSTLLTFRLFSSRLLLFRTPSTYVHPVAPRTARSDDLPEAGIHVDANVDAMAGLRWISLADVVCVLSGIWEDFCIAHGF